MEVKLLNQDKEKGKLSFVIKGISPEFANTLRRTITEEVPTLAIEDIEFKDNSSALYDEIIAHRIGLIPIKTDLKTYELFEECSCKGTKKSKISDTNFVGKGCAKCTLKMTLISKSAGYVYSKEIKSKDSKCSPAIQNLPITKLAKGQKIEFIATAILGQGKNHAKWSPGLTAYKNYPIIEINEKGENCEEASIKCPVKVFEFKKGKLTIANPLNCHFCNACVDICPEGLSVKESKTDFIFNIESWGQLDPKDMVIEAIKIVEKKTDEFMKLLK